MTTAKDTGRTMAQVLHQQIAEAEKMEGLLIEENQALIKRDASAIEQCTRLKNELGETLARLALEQQQLLNKAGLSLSRTGIDQFIANSPQAEKLRLKDTFQRLHQLLDQCQRQNLINGNIIASNRQAAEMALAILRGQNQRNPTLYNANGQTPAADPGNTLAKA